MRPCRARAEPLLELAQSASALLATSLASVARELAVHGFSSNGRHDVGYYRFKDFDEPYDELSRARLAGMRASLSTRLGAALRHAGQALAARDARRKLLLVVTDGEPSDIDVHDPKYLLLDAKQATISNRRLGVTSFCVGLDPNAEANVSCIFGAGNYSLLNQLESLRSDSPSCIYACRPEARARSVADGPRITAVRGMHGPFGRFAVAARCLALDDTRFVLVALVDGGHPAANGRTRRQIRRAQQALAELSTIRTRRGITHLGDRPRQLEAAVIAALEFIDWHTQ